MRIGFDASVASGQPGGTGTYAVQLLNALICQRPDWTFVLYFRRTDQPNPLLTSPAGRTNVERVTVSGSPNGWRVQVALPPRLRQDRIDVYQSPGPFLPLRWHGPKVVTIHDLNIYLNVRNWLRPKTLLAWADLAVQTPFSARVARRVITASNSARADLHRLLRVRPDAIRVIPDAPDAFFDAARSEEERSAVRDIVADKPYVLFVGVLSPQKNLRRLLLAFAASSLPRQGVKLVLAGRDESDYGVVMRRLANRLGIGPLLKLPGYVPRSTLRGLYAGARCLVLPSHGEGFGLPVVEAMAQGAPILAANRQAIPEVVGGGGLLFDPANSAELTALLDRVFEDERLRADLSERARLRRKDFSWAKTAQATADVYLEAARG
jgi:glycosyltransferase involved in cell wall biosynthesis